MPKETLRIKFVQHGSVVTEFSMNFRKWRRLHREGGSPFVIETDSKDRIEVTLRDEEMDVEIEGRKAKERRSG